MSSPTICMTTTWNDVQYLLNKACIATLVSMLYAVRDRYPGGRLFAWENRFAWAKKTCAASTAGRTRWA